MIDKEKNKMIGDDDEGDSWIKAAKSAERDSREGEEDDEAEVESEGNENSA